MKSHSTTYNGFAGVDMEATGGVVIQAFSYTLSPSMIPPHAMGVAGIIIFRDDCSGLPHTFDIEVTGCNELDQIMKKYIRGCKLVCGTDDQYAEALSEQQYTFVATRIDDWASVKSPPPSQPPEWPPWGVDTP